MQKKSFNGVKVSVILPSLNVADYIEKCIESVLGQSLQEIEIICIDAGSTDGTYEILEQYAQRDDRMRLIESSMKSYGRQVNMGIEIAKGEYIGVVETDDYIEPKMYEVLYHTAKENDAEYVKADFDDFCLIKKNQILFQNVLLMRNCEELYGTIVNPAKHLFLFERDYNIWSGIYKKEFLSEKQIRLNETAGAAFQDIGFMQQVLSFAEHAVYVNDSFYRYRIDRGASSSFSPKVLMFAYQEFHWLFEECKLKGKTDQERLKGIFRRMVQVLLYEFSKLMQNENIARISEENGAYCTWFRKELKEAVDTKILKAGDFDENIWMELRLLIRNENSYADYKAVKRAILKEAEQILLETVKNSPVIIFGSGAYGTEAYKIFLNKGVNIVAFCDNNSLKWGSYIGDIEIKALDQCIKEYREVYYIIANKNNGKEIRKQLIEAGISERRILDAAGAII